jgi:hypothetical protein
MDRSSPLLAWKIATSASRNTAMMMVETNLVMLRRASPVWRISVGSSASSSRMYLATSKTAIAITM